jgi:tetratricopeptide (TPR) repeat protein
MDEAVAQFAAVVDEDPHDATAIGNQGWILYLAGDYDASIRASERALALDPAQVFTIRNVAHAHLAAGRPDEAAYHYRRAIESRRGGEDFRESIRVVRKLLEARPDTPRGYEMLEMLEEAQAGLTTATEEPPDQA